MYEDPYGNVAVRDELERLINKEDEMGLVNLKFPDILMLLEDLSIWIGDTAATMHKTPHATGMVANNGDKLRGQSIMVGNGKREATSMHGSIKGQMTDKKGMKLGRATLTEVAYSPSMKFNSCSLSRLMKNGWKISGDEKGFKMTKNWKDLIFDIVVRTATGIVYCLYLKHMTNKLA